MPLHDYTLHYGAEEATIATLPNLGFEGGRMKTATQARDVLTLAQRVARFDEADLLDHESYASLYRGETRIFRGCVVPTSSGLRAAHSKAYTLAGAWMEFERRQYLQPWKVSTGEDAGSSVAYGRVILGNDATVYDPDNDFAGRITTGAQITQIVQWAIDHGAPVQIGTIDDGVIPAREVAQDITCAEAIVRMLRVTPDVVTWFDYSTNPPTFHAREAANLTVANVPVTAIEEVPEVQHSWEQKLRRLLLRYYVSAFGTTNYDHFFREDSYPLDFGGGPTPVPGDAGVIVVSVTDLDYYTVGEGDTTLAQRMWDAVNALGWRGKAKLVGADVPQSVGVGRTFNITGSLTADWATMGGVISTCDDDLRGRREVTFGPPGTLSPQDMAGLLWQNRFRHPVGNDVRAAQTTGQSGGDNYGFKTKDPSDEGAVFEMKIPTNLGFQKVRVKLVSRELLVGDVPGAGAKLPQLDGGSWTWIDARPGYTAGDGIAISEGGEISIDCPTEVIGTCEGDISVLGAPT